jgi:plasmid stability protein
MNLILNLPPETEARLRQAAAESGKAPEELALEALDDKLSSEFSSEPELSREEWLKQFHAWVNSHKSRNPNVDDSRESFYPDRW